MSDTPETDRLAEEFKRNTLPDDVKLDILFGFTRKLERECIRAEGETEKLERERNEARDTVERLTEHGLDLLDENHLLKRRLTKVKEMLTMWEE